MTTHSRPGRVPQKRGLPATSFLAISHLCLFITTVLQEMAVKRLLLMKLAAVTAQEGVWTALGMKNTSRSQRVP